MELRGYLGAIADMFDKGYVEVVKDYRHHAELNKSLITETERKFLNQCFMDETDFVDDSFVDYSDESMKGARVSLQNKGIIWVSDESSYGDVLYDIDHEYMNYLGN